MPEKAAYEITWGSLWRVFAIIALVWVLYSALNVFLAILLALVIAAGLDSPVTYLQKKGVPRVLGVLIFFVVGILFLAAIIYAIVPLVIADVTQLFLNIREYGAPVIDSFQASDAFSVVTDKLDQWADALISGTVPLTQVFASLFGNIFLAATVLILSFYLAVGQEGVESFLVSILPSSYEEEAVDIYLKTRKKIGQWLKGQVLLSFIVGFLTFIGLWALGVKYSLFLGILAGLFELIPFVGPIFAGAVSILVAMTTSLNLALYTLIFFIVIQQVENNLLVPIVLQYTTSLNSAVIIISILIGGQVFGFIGIVLAVPISVFLQEMIQLWTVSKKKHRGLGL